MRWLVLFFVVVPLTELYLLIWLSQIIGFGATVAITLVTGVVGGTLAKREGLRVWRQWARALDEMRRPEAGVIDGLLVLVGGAFLLTPGVMTDVVGFALLFPVTRRPIARRIRASVDRRIAQGQLKVVTSSRPPSSWQSAGRADPVDRRFDDVIDTTGEAHDETSR